MRWIRFALVSLGVCSLLASHAWAQYWVRPAEEYRLSQRPEARVASDEPTAASPSDQTPRPPAPTEDPAVPSVRDMILEEAVVYPAARPSCGGRLCSEGEPWQLFPENQWGTKVGGWVQAGYHNKSDGKFNSHPDRLNVHQTWLYAEKAADGQCGWDWGFRADFVYGVDAQDTQAFGNNPGRWDFQNGFDHGSYGWAIPQAYVEVANGDLAIKVGHFFTLEGYEVVTAPDNFFYSHAYTMYNSEPFTHTGAMVSYALSDALSVFGGWTLGWDTGFDQFDQGSSFLGGFIYSLTDNVTMSYFTTFGNFGWRGEGYNHTVVFDVTLTERLTYIFESDYVDTDTDEANDDIGINQYLIYRLNSCWGVGGRFEWWKRDGASLYEATAGVNWKPRPNFVMRPEIRYNWGDGIQQNISKDLAGGWLFGIDAIMTF